MIGLSGKKGLRADSIQLQDKRRCQPLNMQSVIPARCSLLQKAGILSGGGKCEEIKKAFFKLLAKS